VHLMKMKAAAASACLVSASCGAGSLPVTSAAGADLQRFAVYLQDEPIGYMEIRIEPAAGDSLKLTEETVWDLVLMGSRRHVVMEFTAVCDSTLNMGSLDFHLTDGSAVISSSTMREGNTLVTTVGSSGREIETTSSFEGEYMPAAIDLACALLPWDVGQERTFPAFDPATGTLAEAVATCVAIEPADLLGDTVQAARLEIRNMGTTTQAWVWNGQVIRELDSGMNMEMTRVPPGQAGEVTSDRDLYEAFAVQSTTIADPRGPGSRTYMLEGDIDWSAFQLDYPPVQIAEGSRVTVSTHVPQTSVPFPVEVDSTFAIYLASEPMVQSDDPAIVKLADSLTTGCRTAWDAARNISGFVDRAVENTPTVSLPSAVEVLDSRRGDCNEHTVLFVALARAAGIPARTCAGVVYLDGAFGYHAWPLVWVGEWVPMDPTFGNDVADPTHIILAEGNLESQYVITSVMGRLRISEVVAEAVQEEDVPR